MENLSYLVSDILDCIGYSQEVINTRRNFWQHKSQLLANEDLTLNIAGSKAEGITSLFESDIDLMQTYNDTISTDDIQSLPTLPGMTVLQADTRDAPPGYTRLKVISCNGKYSRAFLRDAVFESEHKELYISSTLFASNIMHGIHGIQINRTLTFHDLSGPAVPVNSDILSYDQVLAFPCSCSPLQTWKSRRRLHYWPPADVREAAASMLAQVVPVGCKGSDDQWREWRFCFIQSELKLTFSFNETQIKLYILLKMVAKDVLKNVSKEISSYIMKNVTFWLSELLPEERFRKGNLLTLLVLSLRFLKSAISHWNWLPYYMIPGRNLLSERLSYDSRSHLSVALETLIAEGPRLFLRCTKIRNGLTVSLTSPATLVDYGRRRNMIETLGYLSIILKNYNADESIISTLKTKRLDLILPEWRMLCISGLQVEDIGSLFEARLISLLS